MKLQGKAILHSISYWRSPASSSAYLDISRRITDLGLRWSKKRCTTWRKSTPCWKPAIRALGNPSRTACTRVRRNRVGVPFTGRSRDGAAGRDGQVQGVAGSASDNTPSIPGVGQDKERDHILWAKPIKTARPFFCSERFKNVIFATEKS